MSYSLRQSEIHRRETTDIEALHNLIELTRAKRERLLMLQNEQIDPEMKEIELKRIISIEESLERRKENGEREMANTKRDAPIPIIDSCAVSERWFASK